MRREDLEIFDQGERMEQSPKNVMTLSEAADYLAMHRKTIRRLAEAGKIPGRRIGNEWRFLRHALDRWLSECSL